MARRSPSSSSSLDSGWVRLLDDVFRIPGTNIRFGLDGIIGLVFPAAGDAVTAGAAITLLTRALRERVPTVVLFRMLLNVGLDFLIGLVPGLGDVLDFFYKGSRRNLRLIERFRGQGRKRPGIIDYLVVGSGFVVAVLLVVVPFLVLMWLSTLQTDDLAALLRQAFEAVLQ
ncbi:MAG: DUF4112 domain-containing protein [Myxococcota bacterium]